MNQRFSIFGIIMGVLLVSSAVNAADFNADNQADILWQKDNGVYSVRLMDGSATVLDTYNLSVPATWNVKGISDFNENNKSDILWQRDDGSHVVWLMNESGQDGAFNVNVPTGWTVRGLGDFNADNQADILWQKDNGVYSVRLMDGSATVLDSYNVPVPATWCAKNLSDFNDNNKTDILWQRDDGSHVVWLMNESGQDGAFNVNVPTGWTVQPPVQCAILPQPPESGITGTTLACDDGVDPTYSEDAKDFNSSDTVKKRISSTSIDDPNAQNPSSHNTPDRLGAVVLATEADGTVIGTDINSSYHPIIMSYTQQVEGDYETGDGSADIGDPTHVDGVFVALSQDDGNTWRNVPISNTSGRSSMEVLWDNNGTTPIEYPGHAQKPTMAIEGNYIVVAWNDKFCPSGNPLNLDVDLDADNNKTYPDDYFGVNGTQGSINYSVDEKGDPLVPDFVAPNGKNVYEVPFSCVWTARGIYSPADKNITWHAPIQLTTGARDSNHIWIEGSEVGFAMAWHEDAVGLKSGKGVGPGEGWSGATTGHGTDIWYTSLKIGDFEAIDGVDVNDTNRPQSANNFNYPVRMTDNEQCSNTENEKKPYCNYLCDTYGFETSYTNNERNETKERCLTYDWDMLDDRQAVMDADTGASRPSLRIFKTDTNEHVVVLGYEETKGLKLHETGVGDSNTSTDIAVEGKAVYFESFKFEAIDAFDNTQIDTIQNVAMPLVSSGNIVNVKAEDNVTSELQYENARRHVIGTQIDSCDEGFNFAFMYKQSFEVQGVASDMFIRVNNGFTYDSFVPLNGNTVTNISAQEPQPDTNATEYTPLWTSANLDDNTYDNPYENTFSPRIFLRGENIFVGYEYKPREGEEQDNQPSNFHTNIYEAGSWRGPDNVTGVTKESETTVDARFFTTPRGSESGLESDQSNPNVLFVTWGNIDFIEPGSPGLGKAEGDLFYKRSTDLGMTWSETKDLAARDGGYIQEKEVESLASPDGKTIYNVWLQEEEDFNISDSHSGVDSWFGRVDYNITIP